MIPYGYRKGDLGFRRGTPRGFGFIIPKSPARHAGRREANDELERTIAERDEWGGYGVCPCFDDSRIGEVICGLDRLDQIPVEHTATP